MQSEFSNYRHGQDLETSNMNESYNQNINPLKASQATSTGYEIQPNMLFNSQSYSNLNGLRSNNRSGLDNFNT